MAEKQFTLPATIIEVDGKGYKSGTADARKALTPGKDGRRPKAVKVGNQGAVIPYSRAKALGLIKAETKEVKGPDADK